MDVIIKIPGLQHISQDIFKLLDRGSLVNCRLVNSSWKKILNHTKFWLKKLNSENSSEFQGWKTLAQELDDDQISNFFVLILIKMCQRNQLKPLEIVVKLEDASKKFPELMKFILEHEDIESEVKVMVYGGAGGTPAVGFPGLTPIHLAAFYGLTGTVGKLLKKYTSPNVKTMPYGGTPMYCAAINGQLETVKFLTGLTFTPNAPDNYGITPLWRAALCGHAKIVDFMVQSKVENPNASSQTGDFPGSTPIDVAIQENHFEIVKILVSNLENPLVQNPNGNTPIHEAAKHGHIKIFKFLASKSEEPNAPNANGVTPLKIAFRHNRVEIFRALLSIVLQTEFDKYPTSNLEIICNSLDL